MFRPASPFDLDLLLSAYAADPVGVLEPSRFRRELELDQYRFPWSWLHERDGRLLARGLWWGPPQHQHPISLDCLWVDPSIDDPSRVAGDLIEAAHASFLDTGIERLPDLTLTLPLNWSAEPAAVEAVAWRRRAAASAGLTQSIERLSYSGRRTSPGRSAAVA